MKKILILVLTILFTEDVYAKKLDEKLVCNNNKCDLTITIPKNYSDDLINIESIILNNKMNIDKITYNIYIDNKSNKNYYYVDNSLKFIQDTKIYRTNNDILKTLVIDNNLSDENINKSLKEKKYESIDKYYLDYFNNKLHRNYASINDINDEDFAMIFNSDNSKFLETNYQLQHLYLLYNDNIVINDYNINSYTNYLDGYNLMNKKLKNTYISKNSKKLIYTFNLSRQNKLDDYTLKLNLSYNKNNENGKVIIYYIDELGEFLKDRVIISNKIGTSYTTNKLDIEGYELKEIKGNQEGIYSKDVKEVYYIYELKDNNTLLVNDEINTGINDYRKIIIIINLLVMFILGWIYEEKNI